MLNLALIEPVITSEAELNFKRGEKGVIIALKKQAKLIALPELWVTGFGRKRITDFFEEGVEYGLNSIQELETKCKNEDADLVFGFPEKTTSKDFFFNALNIPSRDRPRAYRKLMVYVDVEKNFVPAMDVRGNIQAFLHKTQNNESYVIAVQLCADLRFPEIARAGARLGASLILNCSQWRAKKRIKDAGTAYPEHWEWLLRARAIENQIYVAGCGAQGTAYAFHLLGRSAVYDPIGKEVKPIEIIPIDKFENAGRVLLYQLDMTRVGKEADPQARHFIPWIEEMIPVVDQVERDTRVYLGTVGQLQTTSPQHDIFLSYASEDILYAREIVRKSKRAGLQIFDAKGSIPIGVDYNEFIREKLENCRELWLLMTPTAINKEWIITEWGAAWAFKKDIFPILLQVSKDDLPERLIPKQFVNFHEINKLIKEALGRKGGVESNFLFKAKLHKKDLRKLQGTKARRVN